MISSVEARPGTGTRTRGSKQGLATRTRARSADAKLSRTRSATTNDEELTEGASTPNHQVTPFTPRSLEEWKYVQKHGEQGQDSKMDAQEMRWLRFLITDVDGCDEEGNPWLTTTHTKGGRRGSVIQGGLDVGKEEGDEDDAVSPLKWYDNQHTPTTTPSSMHSSHNKHNTSNRRRSRSRSPTAANEMIQYHQSISTATIIATNVQHHGSLDADDGVIPTVTTARQSTIDLQQHKQKQKPQPQKQQQQQQQQPQQPPTSGNNSVGKPKPHRRISGIFDSRALSPVTLPTRGERERGLGNMEEGEMTLTDNGLAKLVAKIRKQQLNMGDASLKWTPDRLAGTAIIIHLVVWLFMVVYHHHGLLLPYYVKV